MTTAEEPLPRQELEARLRRPERGEDSFVDGDETLSRLEAVRRLGAQLERGEIVPDAATDGINTHVHTAKSFSYFASPSDAAWQAKLAGIRVFGINDHYTVAGHEEFGTACRILGIEPVFSMEAVAMWGEAEAQGKTVNDPNNPGRTYLTCKGITRSFPSGCDGEADLARMNAALFERNREMTAKLAACTEERLGTTQPFEFLDVLSLTPHRQPTERHVAQVAALFLQRAFPDREERRVAASKLCGSDVSFVVLDDSASLQDTVRGKLLKAGRPAYVEESSEAFIPVERLVAMAFDLGAIPTFPVLGNPTTPWEEDLEGLLDRLEELDIRAVEVIPDRNTAERLLAIVETAAGRGFPVFNGTEHNTKSQQPLVDRFFFDERFRPHFERGARVLIDHQAGRSPWKDS